jgi:uncharacterized protein with PIN domain
MGNKMKCIDCGTEFEEKIEEKELKVTLDNPGDIKIIAKVMTCPQCKQIYSNFEDSLEAMDAFEKERLKLEINKK